MPKEEYLAIAAKRYDELQALNRIGNFYDYESEFVKIMTTAWGFHRKVLTAL